MSSEKRRPSGAAFLLSQLGARAADLFAEQLLPLGIAPFHAGILRIVARTPECNQLALAKHLNVLPSRMVVLIDDLVKKGLVQRQRSETDRRNSLLLLTKSGHQQLERISKIALQHENELCAALSVEERETLAALCARIAAQQGLTPDVHPGFRKL